MFGISIEWWILYILIIVITLVGLKILMNGVSILGAKLRDNRTMSKNSMALRYSVNLKRSSTS
jgi:hypothetical protein